MTIRVTVKNEDTGDDRVISVQQVDAAGVAIPGIPAKELKGGESAENHVHTTNQIVVKEIRCD